MLDGVTSGTNGGWVIGAKGLLHTNDVEVKWANEPRGDVGKKHWRRCGVGTTVSVLIHGKFKMDFRKGIESEETVIMQEPGSYVVFETRS